MKHYFEGWYFKQKCGGNVISFIPGVATDNDKKHAFIQVISSEIDKTLYIPFPFEQFKLSTNPFQVEIDKNIFSLTGIHVDINFDGIEIRGDLDYSGITPIKKSILSPSIMGPFSYLPLMECNHGILSLDHAVNGWLNINDAKWLFTNGRGYIEKDWGKSFPKNWIWIQCNDFGQEERTSIMIAIAHIPYLCFQFPGLIAIMFHKGKEYRFATYNRGKVISVSEQDGWLRIILKKGSTILELNVEFKNSGELKAPVRGDMSRLISECISCNINVKLSNNSEILFNGKGTGAGFERMV